MKVRLLIVAALSLVVAPGLGVIGEPPAGSVAAAQTPADAGLIAQIEFAGDDEVTQIPLESADARGFTFIDQADPRVLLNVINGCDLNDRLWVLAANLTETVATLTITATGSGSSRTFSLPARDEGRSVDPVIGLDALPVCAEIEASAAGAGTLDGTAQYTGVGEGCNDSSSAISLIPRSRGHSFREVRLGNDGSQRVISSDPVVVIDDSGSEHQIVLFAEARLPGRVEGVAISGSPKMLPGRQALDKRLAGVTDGRVRRAFEAAVNGRVPAGLIEELGIQQIDCVYHVRLDFEAPDAKDRLFAAGWLKEDPEVSEVVDDDDSGSADGDATQIDTQATSDEDGRFIIETVDVGGRLDEIPLRAAPSERGSMFRSWTFQDTESLALILDACDYTDSFWALVGSRSESEFDLTILDLKANDSKSYAVSQALGGSLAPAVVDTQAFLTCP